MTNDNNVLLMVLLGALAGCSGTKDNNLGTVNLGGRDADVSSSGGEEAGGNTSVTSNMSSSTVVHPTGGAIAVAGSTSTGGTSSAATGGTSSSGGGISTGGLPATGGAGITTGGAATGGQKGTGGTGTIPLLTWQCSTDADCCVILDNCGSALYLVTATQRSELQAYFGSLTTTACTACQAPPVQLACQAGQCTGTQLPFTSANYTLTQPHCGTAGTGGSASTSLSAANPSATSPVVSAAVIDAGAPQTVFGCS